MKYTCRRLLYDKINKNQKKEIQLKGILYILEGIC